MKKLVIALLLSALMVTPCYANAAHDLAMSYIIADQDPPKEPGDRLYSECDIKPVLMHTTGYCEGTHGSHGDRMREGFCAAAPELYGCAAIIYEAILQDDGTYKIGDYLDTLEIRDTGYGFATNSGVSFVRPDKNIARNGKTAGAGTIECGLHIDVYRDNLSRCWQWMKLTKGMIFVEIVPAKG